MQCGHLTQSLFGDCRAGSYDRLCDDEAAPRAFSIRLLEVWNSAARRYQGVRWDLKKAVGWVLQVGGEVGERALETVPAGRREHLFGHKEVRYGGNSYPSRS
jgi:hypothetical protein